MSSPLRSWLALGALVAVSLGGFGIYAWTREPTSKAPLAPAVDDLAMLAILTDAAGAAAPSHLVASGGRLVTARGATGSIEVRPNVTDASAVPPVGQAIAGVAVSGDDLWVTSGGAVRRLSLSGARPPWVWSEGLARPRAIAADARSVVVVDVDATTPGLLRESRVLRLPLGAAPTPSEPPVVLGRYGGEIPNVVLDHGTAYWADRLEGAILAADETQSEPRVLVTGRGLPGEVVVLGDTIVWVEKRSESLYAMPVAGGAPRLLTQDFAGFSHLTAHAGARTGSGAAVARVAWVNEAAADGIFRVLEVPLSGGDPITVGPAAPSIEALASDGPGLYWLRDGAAGEVTTGD